MRARSLPLVLAALLALDSGCFFKRVVADRIGDALSQGGSTFARDDDLELVKDATPFGLKTLEALLASNPRHAGLLGAACAGFTQYAYAFVQEEADFLEARDVAAAAAQRRRAKRLYLRARDYGLRALDVAVPGFPEQVRTRPALALAKVRRAQVPVLYYTAAAWAGAFSLDITDPDLAVDQAAIEAMMRRALALDEGWQEGAVHTFFIAWEAGHAAAGGSVAAARDHYRRAQELARGRNAAAFVALAEAVELQAQDQAAFESLLRACLAIDAKACPGGPLPVLVAQRRASWLLARTDDLFLTVPPVPEEVQP